MNHAFGLDTGFPYFTGKETADEKIDTILTYLYMLLEYLRYALRNLDSTNFTEAGMDDMLQGMIQPLTIQWEETAGPVAAEYLYARMGEIADLTVNRLLTSRRIPLYLARNTADDNYLRIEQERIEFITGTVKSGAPTQQARNGWGEPIYWSENIYGTGVYIGVDGYPTRDGVRHVPITTRPTAWPVIVYQYDELVKGAYVFSRETSAQTGQTYYTPLMVWGAGDGSGRNIARMIKRPDRFELTLTPLSGSAIGMTLDAETGKLTLAGYDNGRWFGTQAQYDALVDAGEIDADTVYYIEESG